MNSAQIVSFVVIGGVALYIYKNHHTSKKKLPKVDKIRPQKPDKPNAPPLKLPKLMKMPHHKVSKNLIKTAHFV